MRLLSVNVGLPRPIAHAGRAALSGIFKAPVVGPVRLGRLNLEGDGQADLENHGGEDKAVYAYPREHYDHWTRVLDRGPLAPGQFGENLTVERMLETEVCVGDTFRIGDQAVVQITQPRAPCFKLGVRLERPDFVKTFLASRQVGFYLRVLAEGAIAAGDAIERVARPGELWTVARVCELMYFDRDDREAIARLLRLPELSRAWRVEFEQRLRK